MSTKFIQLPTCKLVEFVSSSATSFDVSGFIYNDGTTVVDTADIGDVCFATIEPKTAREELVSFTIDSVTAAGVATLTVTRGLSQKSPYGTGGASFDHQNGSDFVISNNPGLFNRLAAKANDETITGSWQFPTPSHVNNPATKTYTDTLAATKVGLTGDETIAGEKTFSTAPKIPDSGADDEAVTRGELDAEEVKLTGDQTVAGVKTFSSSPIVPTATTSTQAMNKSQVETYIATNSGDIKASDSAYGTTKLDVAADTPSDPKALTATADRVAAIGGNIGTPSASNKFVTEEGATDVQIFTTSDTWTKPTGATLIEVLVWGSGGGGSRVTSFSAAGGGGGGGFSRAVLEASLVGATESVTIGAGGAGQVATGHGSDGNASSFGSLVLAYGGKGGRANDPSTSATTFVEGGDSFYAGTDTSATVPGTSDVFRGGWGGGMISSVGYAGQKSMYGGGGGGCAQGNAAGGLSYSGGNGGAGGASQNAENGSVAGGGGGGCSTSGAHTAGDGGDGMVIVISRF